MTDFETSTDFIRLQKAIKSTLTNIAIHAVYFEDADIERDVDVAFDTLSECFDNIDCITDTVTRRCAKSEIHSVLRDCNKLIAENDMTFDAFKYIEDHIECESVLEDIIDMNCDE